MCAEKEENAGLDAGECGIAGESAEEFRVFAREIAVALAGFGKGFAQGHDAAHGSQSQGMHHGRFRCNWDFL